MSCEKRGQVWRVSYRYHGAVYRETYETEKQARARDALIKAEKEAGSFAPPHALIDPEMNPRAYGKGITVRELMQRFVDVLGSIPTLVVVTLMMLVLTPGMGSIIVAMMISGWIEMSLIARAEVLKVKELEYIQAARTIGASHGHIIFKEIVPNIIGKLVTQIMLSIPSAVFLVSCIVSITPLSYNTLKYFSPSPVSYFITVPVG